MHAIILHMKIHSCSAMLQLCQSQHCEFNAKGSLNRLPQQSTLEQQQ